MSRVSTYAALQAKVRVRYSELLSEEQYAHLSEAEDFHALITQLKQTEYGPYLERIREENLNPRSAAFRIRQRLAETYASLITHAPKYATELLTLMYRRHEIENLKGILRGIISGADWERVNFVLFPLTRTVLPAREMVESGNVPAAVELLRATPYYEVLSYAMRRYSSEQTIFPIEVALDLNEWRDIWKAIQGLPGEDRKHALGLLGGMLDVLNLMWAIRYRVYYNLSEEELINYTLPFGRRVNDEHIRVIAAGADIAGVVQRLFPGIPDVQNLLREPHEGLPRLETLLMRTIAEDCHSEFLGNPFHIGLVLAYLLLLELEVKDLTVLCEAKSSGAERKTYLPLLVTSRLPV